MVKMLVFSFLNRQKEVIYLKILELGGSFAAVFTGSYFCRTEGAIDVNLLLVRISFRMKGCTRRSATPGTRLMEWCRALTPPDHTALLAPSKLLQQSLYKLWRGIRLPSRLQTGEMCCERSSSPGCLKMYQSLGKPPTRIKVPPLFSHFWGVGEYLAFL